MVYRCLGLPRHCVPRNDGRVGDALLSSSALFKGDTGTGSGNELSEWRDLSHHADHLKTSRHSDPRLAEKESAL